MRIACTLVVLASIAGCQTGTSTADVGSRSDGGSSSIGTNHTGSYNLGPVNWSETPWHNACSPIPASIQSLYGNLIVGVSNGSGTGNFCDACVQVTTAMGRSLVAHVVTYGDTMGPNDMDVSQEAYDMLNAGEYPRTMTWHLVSCPTTAPLYVQWQTGANTYWTSFWIRNPRVAIASVVVHSANHASGITLMQGSDGTFTDASGFGMGEFTLSVNGVDGSTFTQTFPSFDPGSLVAASGNM